ncbi:hypothetical protein E4U47_005836 [Claviceps purpurea]|nr:hypothetical protein E4U47_005836 [Claviceps purpurea]
MTVLTEDARLLGEDLGEQILSLSDSTARLTNFMTDQAEVNARLEALCWVSQPTERVWERQPRTSLSLGTGRMIEDEVNWRRCYIDCGSKEDVGNFERAGRASPVDTGSQMATAQEAVWRRGFAFGDTCTG